MLMYKYVCILVISIIFSNNSIQNEEQKNKFDWKLNLIPFVGQIKNDQYIKGGILASLQAYSFYKFSNYNESNQIAKRNTYAWWMLGLYFYGIIDAYVDHSLKSFPKNYKNEVSK